MCVCVDLFGGHLRTRTAEFEAGQRKLSGLGIGHCIASHSSTILTENIVVVPQSVANTISQLHQPVAVTT